MRKKVILHAEDTCSGPFWDEDSCEIGRTDAFFVKGKEYKVDFPGFKEWYDKADVYDPFTDVANFQKEGFDKWVNEGIYLL